MDNTITIKKQTVLEAIVGITSASYDNPKFVCLVESLFGDMVKEGGYDNIWVFCQAMAIESEVSKTQ